MNQPSIQEICEAGLQELHVLVQGELTLDLELQFYGKVRLLYLQGKIDELSELLDQLDSCSSLIVWHLANLRLGIRKRHSLPELRAHLDFITEYQGPYLVEAALVKAQLYDSLDKHVHASRLWQEAYVLCTEHGYSRKGATCFHNRIAADSRVNPERTYIDEYWLAHQMALECNDFQTAGMALCNLARDFQIKGSLQSAYKYINRSIDILESHEFRSMGFFVALANRCHLALELGDSKQAKADFSEISTSEIKEAKAALSVLKELLADKGFSVEGEVDESSFAFALETWAERRGESTQPKVKLSRLEEKLVQALAEGPKSKFQLIEEIYQDKGDLFSKENRLKQLIHRLRGKNFNLVANGDYDYQLRI